MPDIVLATFNARYIHAAFGLRYLMANLGVLRDRAVLVELELGVWPADVVEQLLAYEPKIIALSVYIWNAEHTLATVELLKRIAPEVTVVLGGPEVSHELDQPLVQLADHTVVGEGDLAFADLAQRVLRGEPPTQRILQAPLPPVDSLVLPYALYTDEDLRQRTVYVEASRGCPFKCQFCLSALDEKVRRFPEARFLEALADLYDRGLRQFKFVDRTFNLAPRHCLAILGFFRERYDPDLFVHFELIPDRLPDALKEAIAWFPPGALQFEIGIQSFDEAVAARIERRQDAARVEANIRWLREHTGVHLHTDLIVGLPGESVTGFARGFDRLYGLGPHEIQVGILKRLRGAPIAGHTQAHGMVYSPRPPYEVLRTDVISFDEMQRMKRFARFWDLLANSGHYKRTLELMLARGSAFEAFSRICDALYDRFERAHGIAAMRVARGLYDQALADGFDAHDVGRAMIGDLIEAGRLPLPEFLRVHATDEERKLRKRTRTRRKGAQRQDAHLG